jgi:hypothetical protein
LKKVHYFQKKSVQAESSVPDDGNLVAEAELDE